MKVPKHQQQGDVFATKLTRRVDTSKMEKLNHCILAEGEVTGHCHQVTVGEAVLFRNADQLICEVLSDTAVVTHEEHGPMVLPKGQHKIGIVKEYDHFAEEAKRVAD